MKIWMLLSACVTALQGSIALSSGAYSFLQHPNDKIVNTGYGHVKYNIASNEEVVTELVKDIVNSHYVDDEYLRASLTQLREEVNDNEKAKEINKLLDKYSQDENAEAASTTSSNQGGSLWDRGMKYLRGLFGGDDDDQQPDTDDHTATPEDQSIMDDIEKYLGSIVDNKNGTFEKILNYIVNYVHRNVHFWLFTKRHGGFQDLIIGKQHNVTKSDFKKWKKTVILIHGWINSGDNNYALSMIKAMDKYGDFNIISVDWSQLSYSFYTLSRLSVNFVGPFVAQMIDFLAKHHDLRVSDLHILGHSLGAHIAGIAGMFVKTGKVGHITGFDPASPLFGDNQKYRLDASDGKFVDVIHTSLLGMSDQLGHVDFYPNGGGPSQPGCGLDIAVCPHRRSYQYYIASMTDNNFLAFPCNSWNGFTAGNCTKKYIHMGIRVPKRGNKGKYYLRTASEAPFALGMKTLTATEDTTPIPITHHRYRNKYELI